MPPHIRFLLISSSILLLLAGCQSTQKTASVPFSNGPTTAPHVKGPDTAPPTLSQQL